MKPHFAIQTWPTRAPILVGLLALIALVFGVGWWSMSTQISGAIVAQAVVAPQTDRQIVQHSSGGIVAAINVREGEKVQAGQVLIRLDNRTQRSELRLIELQLYEIIARKSRLVAERDTQNRPRMPIAFLPKDVTSAEIKDMIEGQHRLFQARKNLLSRKINQLEQRKHQITAQISGARAQLSALNEQQNLATSELTDAQKLFSKGLVQAGKITSLRQQIARQNGETGRQMAEIARLQGRITETDMHILELATAHRERAITRLRDLNIREAELLENRRMALLNLARQEIRAPLSGLVFSNQVVALHAVVQAAQPIMYIIPSGNEILLKAQIPAQQIDQIFLGQQASLRFLTSTARDNAQFNGRVTGISADIFKDEKTGQGFYRVEITPNGMPPVGMSSNGLAGRDAAFLNPVSGMPVEILIRTESRTALAYLLKPFTAYFNKAFR